MRPVRLLGAVLAIGAVVLALRWLSLTLTSAHLRDDAQQQWSALSRGEALWHWRLRQRDDVVAGRAFGQATLTANDEGLLATSLDGSPFELGLPAGDGLDLAHWPVLALSLRQPAPAAAALAVRWDNAQGHGCVSTAMPFPASRSWNIDLRMLTWHNTGLAARGGDDACSLPSHAPLLRLVITLPAKDALRLASAGLIGHARSKSSASVTIPTQPQQARQVIATQSHRDNGAPMLQLPASASAEQLLRWRDQIREVAPGAVILTANQTLRANPRFLWPWTGWLALGLYLLALAFMDRRHRAGQLAEPWIAAAALAGPLWLIAGLQLGEHLTAPAALGFVGAFLFAARAEHRTRPRCWRFVGTLLSAHWWLPFAAVPVALLAQHTLDHGFTALIPRQALFYFGWALLQQWLILSVLLCRLERLFKTPFMAVLLAALAFALLHTPNGGLMTLCFLSELYWAWCFARSRALLPIALAHAISALIVGAGLAGTPWLRSLEVSTRFFS